MAIIDRGMVHCAVMGAAVVDRIKPIGKPRKERPEPTQLGRKPR
jgi:hypothetical protein